MLGAALAQAVLGTVLVLVGRWGVSHGERLVPMWMEQEERASRAAVNRRGALLCQWLGWVFLTFSVLVVLAR